MTRIADLNDVRGFAVCGAVWNGSALSHCYGLAAAVWTLSLVACGVTRSSEAIEVPDGFSVSVVADDQLVHDAFCMTTDSQGRPIVSGPGYIRTLIDENGDGAFERYVTWANLPVQGAQGLWSEGNKLYWVGDKGLWRSEDANGDLIGDSAPTQLLKLPTGGEHDAHAIRRGPDGYWYLIVGNYASDIQKIENDSAAPVRKARAGTIWRISPDFARRGAWAHGFRNAYDFDFLPNGQIVTFDSDEEREVTFPWYRPTRVLVVSPGSDGGWIDSAWFDMDHRVTMPQVISKLGRASPTGVTVYRHRLFPEKYRDAAFVLDWTFGRVIAIFPQPTDVGETNAKPDRFMAETFMQSTGTAGFAPTDLCVAPDGSLLVCVGGRGTAGAVYRISFSTPSKNEEVVRIRSVSASTAAFTEEELSSLASILSKPCPWESWSVREWSDELKRLPSETLDAVLDGRLQIESSNARIAGQWRQRAAQILTYIDQTPNIDSLQAALAADCTVTNSAAWWLLGRASIEIPEKLVISISENAARVSPSNTSAESTWDQLLGGLAWRQRHESLGLRKWPIVATVNPLRELDWHQQNACRQIQLWALSRLHSPGERTTSSVATTVESLESLAARVLYGVGSTNVEGGLMDRLALSLTAGEIGKNTQEILETLTLLQCALGDFRHSVPLQSAPSQISVFDGYRALYARKLPDKIREGWTRWCETLVGYGEQPDRVLIEMEALRTIAMLESASPSVVDLCLKQISPSSHPTSDLHALIVLAASRAQRTPAQTAATAAALPALLAKTRELGLSTDNSWSKRLEQIFKALLERDAALAAHLIPSNQSIDQDTAFWLEWTPSTVRNSARSRLVAQLTEIAVSEWPETLVRFACAESVDPRLLKKIRAEAKLPLSLLMLELLTKSPTREEYPLMLDSLRSGTRDLWPMAWKGLSRLPADKPADEIGMLAILWAKLRQSPMAEISTTSLVSRLRSNAWKLRLAGVPSTENWEEWSRFFAKHLDTNAKAKLQELDAPPADWLAKVRLALDKPGDAARGEALFQRAKCHQCHGGGSALGPSLTGVSRRFSSEDLFRAIYEPSRDVSDRYRSLKILTNDGEILVGMVVYESIDGVTLQTADGKTHRINQADIESKSYSPISIMPAGLLDGASEKDLADLYAFLKRL